MKRNARGVAHAEATVGESPTTATTVPSSPASWIVLRKIGSVSIFPTAGSTRSGSCHSQPGWFSSEPRWWSTVNRPRPSERAEEPTYTADRRRDGQGKGVSVSVDTGGRGVLEKNQKRIRPTRKDHKKE